MAARSLLLLTLLLALAGCAALPPAASAPDAFKLTVAHTNDTWGYLDPCG